MTTTQTTKRDYMLGHEQNELERLMRQAEALGPISRHLLQLAGLGAGMHVLDLGCGPGDVSFLAARLVGPHGSVVGVDASADVIALARRRAERFGFDNVHFIARDVTQPQAQDLSHELGAGDARFDALIGRLVLMYLPDAASVLRRLVGLLRPGAIVTFQEFELAGARSEPRCDLFEHTVKTIEAAFAHRRLDLRLGAKQVSIFRAAGLPAPEMRLEGRVESGPDALVYDALTEVMRTILPVVTSAAIASAEEVGVDTLAHRLREEAIARNATLAYVPLVGAWTRVPMT
ncbi:MAG TPA: class I SAM-dependent methyltransferase [Polyangiales bacterium]|nr:class I SAM-dependent methyltransferase [Polyangiales bacterium]